MKGLSSENKKWRNNNAQSQLRKITDKKGKLESYQRKTIIYGDGFCAPEQRIGKTQTMNQKLVFVELKVTNTIKETMMIINAQQQSQNYKQMRQQLILKRVMVDMGMDLSH